MSAGQAEDKNFDNFSIELYVRFSVSLNLSLNTSLNHLLRRDAMRVAFLTNLLSCNTFVLHLESFGADHIDPSFMGGEYFMRVAVGTPSFYVEMLVDTSSDLTWL
ncbi:hypothetical protein Tsubulata_020174 [Turnera subulata]|uniref:Peptidase A1 domain-containing protein n=1 Tax=Turnera subulata TaxID=218843 RepID=A0A9Q0FRA4_9ROSI|nr:hypothetical protein Tsubulata_020174 [Turnera subulata]